MRSLTRRARGMTLIEIMVVLAILGLMAASISVAAVYQFNCSKVKKARLDCHQLVTALDLYFARTGKYPPRDRGLEVLVDTHIIKTLENDPWGNPYVYALEGGEPVVSSLGADGAPGGEDFNADVSSRQREN